MLVLAGILLYFMIGIVIAKLFAVYVREKHGLKVLSSDVNTLQLIAALWPGVLLLVACMPLLIMLAGVYDAIERFWGVEK